MPQAVVGFDYGKYERLQSQDQRRKEQLEQECEEAEKFVDGMKKVWREEYSRCTS